jgi:hypothetical protein
MRTSTAKSTTPPQLSSAHADKDSDANDIE